MGVDEEDNWTPCNWANVTINGDTFTVNISENDYNNMRECAILFSCEEDFQLDWFWIEQPELGGREVTFTTTSNVTWENDSHNGCGAFTVFSMRCKFFDENWNLIWDADYENTGDGLVPASNAHYPDGQYWTTSSAYHSNKFKYFVPYDTTSVTFRVVFDSIQGHYGEGGMPIESTCTAVLDDTMTECNISLPVIVWNNC